MTKKRAFFTIFFFLFSLLGTIFYFHNTLERNSEYVVEKLGRFIGLDMPPNERVSSVTLDVNAIAVAISLYHKAFHKYPQGNHAAIIRALTGKNPTKTVFLESDLNEKHEFLDSWGTAYDIQLSQNGELKIISAGPNGIFGDENDEVLEKK